MSEQRNERILKSVKRLVAGLRDVDHARKYEVRQVARWVEMDTGLRLDSDDAVFAADEFDRLSWVRWPV